MAEKLPTIIDNRGDNTLLHALQRLLPGVQGLDITTGLFEIGSFLLLEQLWQGLDKIRILMGDETTRRTKKEIVESLHKKSDASIEGEKERDDALTGLAAIREAIASGQILQPHLTLPPVTSMSALHLVFPDRTSSLLKI